MLEINSLSIRYCDQKIGRIKPFGFDGVLAFEGQKRWKVLGLRRAARRNDGDLRVERNGRAAFHFVDDGVVNAAWGRNSSVDSGFTGEQRALYGNISEEKHEAGPCDADQKPACKYADRSC